MPSLQPSSSLFARRNRRSQQPQENERRFWRRCKTALMKRLPYRCFANAWRQEEADQMMKELEQTLKEAEDVAETLRENGSDCERDLSRKEKVPTPEDDMIAKHLEQSCIDSRQASNAENNNGSTGETGQKGKAESDENDTSESGDSLISDIRNKTEKTSRAEQENPIPSEDVEEKHASNGEVQKDEVPSLPNACRGESPLPFSEKTIADDERKKKYVSHGFEYLKEYKKMVRVNKPTTKSARASECVEETSLNTIRRNPSTPVPPNMWQLPLDVPKNTEGIWGATDVLPQTQAMNQGSNMLQSPPDVQKNIEGIWGATDVLPLTQAMNQESNMLQSPLDVPSNIEGIWGATDVLPQTQAMNQESTATFARARALGCVQETPLNTMPTYPSEPIPPNMLQSPLDVPKNIEGVWGVTDVLPQTQAMNEEH